uniref:O-methyltransferase n=1 Tax=Ascaris lumbricoides TaxID=6252 RepID=A0A0M3I4T3_ASCLU
MLCPISTSTIMCLEASNLTSSKVDKNTSKLLDFYTLISLYCTLPMHPMSNISKSPRSNDPIVKYCTSVSVKQDPILQKLSENTVKNAPMGGMIGAPEVLQFGQNLIRLTHAKRALDIGTFTGASALAWALAVPADGEVISMDINHDNLKRYGKEFIDSKPEVSKKINFRLGPAVQTLGTFTGASALAWALAVPADGEVISMDINHDNLKRYGKEFIDSKPEVSKKINFRLGPAVQTLDETGKLKMLLFRSRFSFSLFDLHRTIIPGTFTGASALAWALAVPADGEVISMDISHENLKRYGKELIDSKPEISKKINFKLGPAVQTLGLFVTRTLLKPMNYLDITADSLIAAGESGKWDFAFIDADKINYPNYYEKCVQLLRPGGIIVIDNALRCGRVIHENKDDDTKAIDETNHTIASDTRVDNMLLNLGDGAHVVFKKHE